jgi:transcriptional regulator with XRE-family HTH domain
MTSSPVGTYLRFLRRKHGLRQRDLARIIGSVTASQVSRHERSRSLPTLLVAFGYQVAFGKPVAEIFPGFYHAVETSIGGRLEEFRRNAGGGAANNGPAMPVYRDGDWLDERENPEPV